MQGWNAEEIKNNSHRRNKSCWWMGSLPAMKLTSSFQFNLYILFPVTLAMRFSLQLDKVIPKCRWNNKEPRIAKTDLKKK